MRRILALVGCALLCGCGDAGQGEDEVVRVERSGIPGALPPGTDVGNARAAAEKLASLQKRTLTDADVEKFLSIYQQYKEKAKAGNQAAAVEFVRSRGLDMVEWGAITSRVMTAYGALKAPGVMPEGAKADVEVVRKYMDRIDAALDAD